MDLTLNLWLGCLRLCLGCVNCPSCIAFERDGYRYLGGMPVPPGVVWPNLVSEWMKGRDPREVKPGSLVLLCGESDFFIEAMEFWWAKAVELIRSRPDVMFLALTKRLEQAKKFVARFGVLPNLWIGTSAENQRALDERIPVLYSVPAAGYVISLQPLLAPITNLEPYLFNQKLMRVVAGREMGTKGRKARPCETAWLEEIEAACRRHRIWYFCTRYTDKNDRACTAPTANGRGSDNHARRSYNRYREFMPTIGELMGLDKLLAAPDKACRRLLLPPRKPADVLAYALAEAKRRYSLAESERAQGGSR